MRESAEAPVGVADGVAAVVDVVVAAVVEDVVVAGVVTRCMAETQPLGTAGGFLNAVRLSGETPAAWLVVNGDSLVFANLTRTAAELSNPAVAGVVIGCAVADASRYGTLAIGPAAELRGFLEKRPGRGVINAGTYLLQHSLVWQFPNRVPLSFEQEGVVFSGTRGGLVADEQAGTRLLDSSGHEIPLVTGRTFFQIVPLDTKVTSGS